MSNHSTKTQSTQDLQLAHSAHVEVPLPMLSALEDIESAFFGVCIEAGKHVLGAMMEHDRTALCGLPWKPDEERPGRRAGSTESPITLGGRRIAIRRPRVRSIDGDELSLPSFDAATDRDPLDRQTLAAMAAGVPTRRYGPSLDPLPPTETERSTSKSAVSRRFVALTEQKLGDWLSQPLDELDLKIVMLDGIHFRDHCILVALGVDSDGKKHPLGIREGNTENSAVARALLSDLVERGLRTDRAIVFVIDGSKALRQAIEKTFGSLALIQRCAVHKRRNVLGHLPQSERGSVKRALDEAWNSDDPKRAKRLLENLARSLESQHPGAAASLGEGLDDTLTLLRLGVRGTLFQSIRSTNAIESLNDKIATYTRRVKQWSGGKMMLRWVGAAILDAREGMRGVRGLKDMTILCNALERHEKTLHSGSEAA
jgi:transposase-like protein